MGSYKRKRRTGASNPGSFNIPDLRGAFLRGAGTSTAFNRNSTISVAGYQSDTFQSHYHTVANPGYQGNGGGTAHGSQYNAGHAGGHWTTSSTGSTETRPNNAGVQFMIKI